MITTIAVERLDRVMTRDGTERRLYQTFQLGPQDMAGLHLAVKAALATP
jgi:hypothetical protein